MGKTYIPGVYFNENEWTGNANAYVWKKSPPTTANNSSFMQSFDNLRISLNTQNDPVDIKSSDLVPERAPMLTVNGKVCIGLNNVDTYYDSNAPDLYVHGKLGIGKTTLFYSFADTKYPNDAPELDVQGRGRFSDPNANYVVDGPMLEVDGPLNVNAIPGKAVPEQFPLLLVAGTAHVATHLLVDKNLWVGGALQIGGKPVNPDPPAPNPSIINIITNNSITNVTNAGDTIVNEGDVYQGDTIVNQGDVYQGDTNYYGGDNYYQIVEQNLESFRLPPQLTIDSNVNDPSSQPVVTLLDGFSRYQSGLRGWDTVRLDMGRPGQLTRIPWRRSKTNPRRVVRTRPKPRYGIEINWKSDIARFEVVKMDHSRSDAVLAWGRRAADCLVLRFLGQEREKWQRHHYRRGRGKPVPPPQVSGDRARDVVTVHPNGSVIVDGSITSFGHKQFSDIRMKDSITPIDDALRVVMAMRGVSFLWKRTEGEATLPRQLGMIAQEVEEALPSAVSVDNGAKSIDYAQVMPVLLEAIKEQQEMIRLQGERLDELMTLCKKLASAIDMVRPGGVS